MLPGIPDPRSMPHAWAFEISRALWTRRFLENDKPHEGSLVRLLDTCSIAHPSTNTWDRPHRGASRLATAGDFPENGRESVRPRAICRFTGTFRKAEAPGLPAHPRGIARWSSRQVSAGGWRARDHRTSVLLGWELLAGQHRPKGCEPGLHPTFPELGRPASGGHGRLCISRSRRSGGVKPVTGQ